MLIAGMGVVVVGASVAVLVLSRRWKSRGGRVVARPVAIVGLALVCAVLGVYVWALSSTDSSPMARAIAWGTSSNGDQNLFPAATMEASNDPLVLEPSDGGEVHEAANAVLGARSKRNLGPRTRRRSLSSKEHNSSTRDTSTVRIDKTCNLRFR
jgi:hypothetical protein